MLHTFVGDDADEVRDTGARPDRSVPADLREPDRRTWPRRSRRSQRRPTATPTTCSPRAHAPRRWTRCSTHAVRPLLRDQRPVRHAATCSTHARQFAALGVDEIACLIDFGVDTDDGPRLPAAARGVRAARRPPVAAPRRARGTAATMDVQAARDRRRVGRPPRRDPPAVHAVAWPRCWPPTRPSAPRWRTLEPPAGRRRGASRRARRASCASSCPARITNMYGPTETTIWSLTYELDRGARRCRADRPPIANTARVHRSTRTCRPVPPGVPGEL